ncbi:MAG: hypothetical protein ACK4TB_09355 [Gemmobacter sp.]
MQVFRLRRRICGNGADQRAAGAAGRVVHFGRAQHHVEPGQTARRARGPVIRSSAMKAMVGAAASVGPTRMSPTAPQASRAA